ncbi:MAG: nitrilase family protein [Flavitalea sp.]
MKSPSDTLLVTLVQTNLVWENPKANLELFETKINSVKDKMEVVVLPEMFSTGFSMNPLSLAEEMSGESVKWMRRMAMEKKIILTGSLIIKEEEKYFNRLIWMQPNGEYFYYDKRHLFAYGGEGDKFSAGSKRLIVSVKGWRLHLMVCYDLRFPMWARQQRPIEMPDQPKSNKLHEPEYDVLIFAANWPDRRSHAWKTLLQARAIENQCYVIGVNRIGKDGNDIQYAGDSMVVDPMGAVVYTPADRDEIFTYALTLSDLKQTRENLPFLRDADSFLIGH